MGLTVRVVQLSVCEQRKAAVARTVLEGEERKWASQVDDKMVRNFDITCGGKKVYSYQPIR